MYLNETANIFQTFLSKRCWWENLTCVASGPAKNGLPLRQVLSFSSVDWFDISSAAGRGSNLLESTDLLSPPKFG
jgi:hypothetical protein